MLQELTAAGHVEFTSPSEPARPSHWLIGIAEPARECDTCRRLEDIGIGTYLPIVVKQRRIGRNRVRDVTVPLLQPYFFVPASITDREYYDVLNTRGVVDFLAINGKPAALREGELARVRYHEERFEQLRLDRILKSGKGPRFIVGEDVKITVGFAILDAEVHAIGTNKIKVKLKEGTLFGRDVVEVDLGHIHHAG